MRARELQTSQWGISAEPDIIIQMLFVCLQWRTSSFSYVRPDTWRMNLFNPSDQFHFSCYYIRFSVFEVFEFEIHLNSILMFQTTSFIFI